MGKKTKKENEVFQSPFLLKHKIILGMTKKILSIDTGVHYTGVSVIIDNNVKELVTYKHDLESENATNFEKSGVFESPAKERAKIHSQRRRRKNIKKRVVDVKKILIGEQGIFPSITTESLKEYRLSSKKDNCLNELRISALTQKIDAMHLVGILSLYAKKRGSVVESSTIAELKDSIAEYENEIKTVLSQKEEGYADVEKELKDKLKKLKDKEKKLSGLKKTISSIDNYLRKKQITVSEFRKESGYKTLNEVLVFSQESLKQEFSKITKYQQQFYPQLTDSVIKNIESVIWAKPITKKNTLLINNCTFYKKKKGISVFHPLAYRKNVWALVHNFKFTFSMDGSEIPFRIEEKKELVNFIYYKKTVKTTEVLEKFCNIKRISNTEDAIFNFSSTKNFTGNQFLCDIFKIVKSKNVHITLEDFDALIKDNLWHIFYAQSGDIRKKAIANYLTKNGIVYDAQDIDKIVKVKVDRAHTTYSEKACKKLIQYLEEGSNLYESEKKLKSEEGTISATIKVTKGKKIQNIKSPTTNPYVKKVLNNVINVINKKIEEHNGVDEIIIEVAKTFCQSPAQIEKHYRTVIQENERINRLCENTIEELGAENSSSNRTKIKLFYSQIEKEKLKDFEITKDKEKFLSKEAYALDVVTNKKIKLKDALNIELYEKCHILPESVTHDNAMENLILSCKKENKATDNDTIYTHMLKKTPAELEAYTKNVKALFKGRKQKLLFVETKDISSNLKGRQFGDLNNKVIASLRSALEDVDIKVRIVHSKITNELRNFLLYPKAKAKADDKRVDILLPYWNYGKQYNVRKGKNEKETHRIIKENSKKRDTRNHAIDSFLITLADTKLINDFSILYKNLISEEKKLIQLDRIIKESIYRNYNIESIDEFRDYIIKCYVEKTNVRPINDKYRRIDNIVDFKHSNESIQKIYRGALHEDTIYTTRVIDGSTYICQRVSIPYLFKKENEKKSVVKNIVDEKCKQYISKLLNIYNTKEKRNKIVEKSRAVFDDKGAKLIASKVFNYNKILIKIVCLDSNKSYFKYKPKKYNNKAYVAVGASYLYLDVGEKANVVSALKALNETKDGNTAAQLRLCHGDQVLLFDKNTQTKEYNDIKSKVEKGEITNDTLGLTNKYYVKGISAEGVLVLYQNTMMTNLNDKFFNDEAIIKKSINTISEKYEILVLK